MSGYRVLRNGTEVGTSATTSLTDDTAAPNTAYSYTVVAYDVGGNSSARVLTGDGDDPSGLDPTEHADIAHGDRGGP